jgi:hypothetical protein
MVYRRRRLYPSTKATIRMSQEKAILFSKLFRWNCHGLPAFR